VRRRFRNAASIPVILAEDTVGRLEARTALPPLEAEPDAQQREAAAVAAAPDAQQAAAVVVVADPDAQQVAVVAAMQSEARPPVRLAEFAETAVGRSWIQATWFLVRAPEPPMVVAAEEQAVAVRLWFPGSSASALGQEQAMVRAAKE